MLNNLDSMLLTLYHHLPFGASFLAGILTFLSPCILPLIPPYMSYISGICIENLAQDSRSYRLRVIYTSLFFIAGFCLVFITLGLFVSSSLGHFFTSIWVRYIAGGIIIAFGIHFIFPLKFRFLYKHFSLSFDHHKFGFLSPFILGIGFSVGWSPCVGPILASILTLSMTQSSDAFWLMLCYCLGLGLAFFLVALLINTALSFLKKITPFMKIIEIISGILLILIGILIVSKKTDFLL